MGACMSSSGYTPEFTGVAANLQDAGSPSQPAFQQAGMAPGNVIFAVDFTKANIATGLASIGKSMHSIDDDRNPYEQVMMSLAQAVYTAPEEAFIPAMGFGDATTQDMGVFSWFNGDAPARGLKALMTRYRELVPCIKPSSLTSFAPTIYQAMRVVADSVCQHHVLVIITCSKLSRPRDLDPTQLSRQEQATINAIVAASMLPLSIVVVGVGDGPWDGMRSLCDKLPERRWSNFRFLQYSGSAEAFATQALSDVPAQLKAVQKLKLLGCQVSMSSNVRVHPPPVPAVREGSSAGATKASPLLAMTASDNSDGTASSNPKVRPTPFDDWAGPGKGGPQGPIVIKAPILQDTTSPFANWVRDTTSKQPPRDPLPQVPVPPPYSGPMSGPNGIGIPQQGPPYMPPPMPGPIDMHHQGYAPPPQMYPMMLNPPGMPPPMAMPMQMEPSPMLQQGGPPLGETMSAPFDPDNMVYDQQYICPISKKLMTDPVTARDGYTYDRASIMEWFEHNDTSPMTEMPMLNKELTPDEQLKNSIDEFLAAMQGGSSRRYPDLQL